MGGRASVWMRGVQEKSVDALRERERESVIEKVERESTSYLLNALVLISACIVAAHQTKVVLLLLLHAIQHRESPTPTENDSSHRGGGLTPAAAAATTSSDLVASQTWQAASFPLLQYILLARS